MLSYLTLSAQCIANLDIMAIDLIPSFFSTAAGVRGTGVGSRWLTCLTPKFHTSLFGGSMLPRLHVFMSAVTHSDQFFLGLPLPLALGIVILVMEFVQEEECATCPNHQGLTLPSSQTPYVQ